ncbi:hypothetical protein CcaCcLH18_05025 [Colletotrichum camelliae]|nr:hypothetical protein CcaCcLH18_05025 [Colletotrichum camelliae]
MQEHSKQQVAGDSPPKAQQNAAEKLSEAMMSLNMAANVTANQAPKSSPASDATTHELDTAAEDSATVGKDSDCQRNTGKSAKKLADKERSKKKRAAKKLKIKGVGMESIGKASDSKDNDKDGGDKDVGENNIDGNCTLEELLEEGEELLEDLRHFKMQDQMKLSVHPIMRAALMEDGAARREENHKAWAVSRDLFIARAEAAIRNKQATAQKPSAEEAQAIRLLQEYLRMKIIVL